MAKRKASVSHVSPAKGKGGKAAKPSRLLSVASRAQQRLRESFSSLGRESADAIVHPETGRTLRQALEWEIEQADQGIELPSGLYHNDELRTIFAAPSGADKQLLALRSDAGEVRPQLPLAMAQAQSGRPNRSALIDLFSWMVASPAESSQASCASSRGFARRIDRSSFQKQFPFLSLWGGCAFM